jgi:hypothetical protein
MVSQGAPFDMEQMREDIRRWVKKGKLVLS